jgi:hypothetical protein
VTTARYHCGHRAYKHQEYVEFVEGERPQSLIGVSEMPKTLWFEGWTQKT